MHSLPAPFRCRPGITAIDVRYSGRLLVLKNFLSIAHGFRVESVSVAMSRLRYLAM